VTAETASPEIIDPRALDQIREWVESRLRQKWAPGYSEEFRSGYDTATYEVAAMLGPAHEKKAREALGL
jgi:hypothetical protein